MSIYIYTTGGYVPPANTVCPFSWIAWGI
jgi:hypothetical protein